MRGGTTWTPENGTQTTTGTWPNTTTSAYSYYDGTRSYYNWRAATAGTTSEDTESGNADGSVCPQQWVAPTKENYVSLITTAYSIADSSTGSTKLRTTPLNFSYTGVYNYRDGVLDNKNNSGSYWSRTAESATDAYRLSFNRDNVFSQFTGPRVYGFALRCLAKP